MKCVSSVTLGYFSFASSSIGIQKSAYSWKPQILRRHSSSCYNIKSLHTNHVQAWPLGVDNDTKIIELKEITQQSLKLKSHSIDMLKLVDALDRLGIAFQFEDEVNQILGLISDNNYANEDLSTTSLSFRLLRQNGYSVTPDVFQKFVDKNGNFKDSLGNDIQGMLSLLEASYLGSNGEEMLSKAMIFTKNHLKSSIYYQFDDKALLAIEQPRHLRMARLETRRYIDELGKGSRTAPYLVELAKLDFNRVQLLHQNELAQVTRWWKDLALVENLGFGRDRPTECYLWAVGILPDPKYSECRMELAKTIAILLVIDDMFDSYGSLDDLVRFTQAIQRWDLNAIQELPEYMKICYMALYNTIHEIGYKILKRHGRSVILQLKKTWIGMIEAYLQEAKWFTKGYIPTSEEYLENGVTTAGSYMALIHIFFLIGEGVTEQMVQMMDPYPKLFSNSGRILRLWDDLGTATEEQERGGDVASSIDCLMREKGLSTESEAREHIKQLIHSLWREMNGELIYPQALPMPIIKAALNMSRTAQVIYQHGDDNKFPSVGDCVKSLFFTPLK